MPNDIAAIGTVKVQGFPEAFCFESTEQFLQALEQFLIVELPASITNVVVSNEEPANRDAVWFRFNNAGQFIGIYLFTNGQWTAVYPVLPVPSINGSILGFLAGALQWVAPTASGQILMFIGSSLTWLAAGEEAEVLTITPTGIPAWSRAIHSVYTDVVPALNGAGETILYTITIPANTFTADGDALELYASGTYGPNDLDHVLRTRINGVLVSETQPFDTSGGMSGGWEYRSRFYRIDATDSAINSVISESTPNGFPTTNTLSCVTQTTNGFTPAFGAPIVFTITGESTTPGNIEGTYVNAQFIPATP